MRILHVNHLLDPRRGGGTAERTYQLSRKLALQGADCTILTMDIGETRSRVEGIPRLHIEALPCINARFFVPKISSGQIDQIVGRADVVQIFGNWTLLNMLVWRACRRLNKPFVFCPAGALLSFGRSRNMKALYTRFVSSGIVRDAHRCICVTDDERQNFLKFGAAEEKIATIPNGIYPAQYRPANMEDAIRQFRAKLDLPSEPFIFFLGRLNVIKGPDLLLRAFRAIATKWPAHHLVFGGPDGGMLAQLREMATASTLANRVHFIGFVTAEMKTAALSQADLLVIPSRSEAMSIVVLEAGACGCAALFTDACGLEEFDRQGAGIMVPVSWEAIAAALDEALSQPSALKRKGELLKSMVMADFLWQGQAEKHMAMYRAVLAEAPPVSRGLEAR